MNTILVVDDEIRIRNLYRSLLSLEGYHVLEAENADTANEILKKEPVDLVLLDLRMPLANGVVLHEILKLFHRKTKVIVSSVFPIDRQKRLAPGAMDYFDKSQGLQELFSKIEAALPRTASSGCFK
jgi:DNA-binding response OmpR family regulator